jgi:hypothetical protein
MSNESAEAMSHERLAAIHGRLALISAWPWKTSDFDCVQGAINEQGYRPRVAHADGSGRRAVDAEFIAHAPEDIDALLAEVQQLRVQNEQLRAELDDALRDLADCEAEL